MALFKDSSKKTNWMFLFSTTRNYSNSKGFCPPFSNTTVSIHFVTLIIVLLMIWSLRRQASSYQPLCTRGLWAAPLALCLWIRVVLKWKIQFVFLDEPLSKGMNIRIFEQSTTIYYAIQSMKMFLTWPCHHTC